MHKDISKEHFDIDEEYTLFCLWTLNNKKRFLAKNIETNVVVLIRSDPLEKFKKYNNVYGLIYMNGKYLRNGKIYGASKKQWKIIPLKDYGMEDDYVKDY